MEKLRSVVRENIFIFILYSIQSLGHFILFMHDENIHLRDYLKMYPSLYVLYVERVQGNAMI